MWSIQDHHEEPYSSCLVNPCGCLPSAYNCNSLTNEPSSSSLSTSSSLLSSNSTTTPSVNPLLLKRQQRQEHSSESQGISLKRFPSTTMRMLQGMSKKVQNYRPDAVTHVNSKTTPISGKKTTMIPSFKDKPVVMNHSASPTLFDCQSHILPLHAHQNVLSCNSLHQFSLLRYFLMLSILIILPVCANASSLLHQHQHSGGSALSSVSLFSLYESESLSPRTVHTKYGALRGVLVHYKTPDLSRTAPKGSSSSAGGVSSSHMTKTVEVFLGVPYATPPVGSLRFMPPVTPTHWPGVKMAKRFSPICPQKIPESLRHHRMVDLSGSSNGNNSRSHVSSSSSSSVTRGASNSPKPSFNFTPNSYGSLSSPTSSSHSTSSSMSSSSDSKVGHLKRMASIVRNQSEDCLYLNIYAPYTSPPSTTSSQHSSSVSSSPSVQSSSSSSSSSSVSASTSSSSSSLPSSTSSQSTSRKPATLYPVVVFIHGDSFDWSSANPFDGSLLPGFGEFVLVTLNYRLGLFGFLPASVDGSGPRGNYGLMDQVAALHWVQENIVEFGGDPLNVTLVGHGFGAACVNLLMVSPLASSALFTRTVLLSGSALCPWSGTCPWATNRDADTNARLLGKSLNCPTYDNLLMVECLRSKTVDELLSVDMKIPEHSSAFGPIIDGIVIPSDVRSIISPISETTTTPSSSSGIEAGGVTTGPGVQISFRFPNSPSTSAAYNESKGSSSSSVSSQRSNGKTSSTGSSNDSPADSTLPNRISSSSSSSNFPANSYHQNKSTLATPIIMEQGTYSTALLVTIAVGCALLVLNMLIFAGVYYQLDRAKSSRKERRERRQQQQQETANQNDVSGPSDRNNRPEGGDPSSPYKARTVTFDGVNSSVHLDCGYNSTGGHVDFAVTPTGHEPCPHNSVGPPHVDWYHPQTVVHWAN